MTSMNELVALRDLGTKLLEQEMCDTHYAMVAARHEAAICKAHLAASLERERTLNATILELRHELLQAHDLAGRVESVKAPLKFPTSDWTRVAVGDRRRVGA